MGNEPGPLWLRNINVDVIIAITAWLDPLSILRLSYSCKSFQAVIDNDPFIWHRVLRSVMDTHFIAPHSFDGLSISEIKRLSTRPGRLSDALQNSTLRLHPAITRYVLDYSSAIPPRTHSGSFVIQREIVHIGSKLLPGGRWIISGVADYEEKATYLFCWDLSRSRSGGAPLQPVASIKWQGLQLLLKSDWIQVQLGGSRDIILAFPLRGWEYSSGRPLTCEVLRLTWTTNSDLPAFIRVAQLEPAPRYMKDNDYWEYHLDAEYLIIETVKSILIWNWREDAICLMSSDDEDWANGSGFLMAAIPPHVFVFPHGLKEILVIGFPLLHPVGSQKSFERTRPSSKLSYPFIGSNHRTGNSKLYSLDRWRPPSRRTAMHVLRSSRMWSEGGPLFYVVSLCPKNATPPAPSFVEYSAASFPNDPEELNSMTVLDGAGVALLRFPHDPADGNDQESLITRFYRVTEGGGFGPPYDQRFKTLFPAIGIPTPLCFVSGTALLKSKKAGPKPNSLVIGVISLNSGHADK
ncbi:hypothetical protein DL93DRAFT_2160451 [Clavulina sp. PMI_390]|nr:hypothetical protein DL93DRAFT_2160451 [Clavulina sp. PMI_390]